MGGPPREVVVISSDEDEDEGSGSGSGKWAVLPGRLGWVAKLDDALAPVPRKKKKGKGGGVRVGEEDDCVILDGDPHRPAAFVGAKGRSAVGAAAADEVEIVAVKGEIACKDFPHSRHVCSELPFGTTSHVKHCSMCYCFVCDAPAPCKYWGKGVSNNDHCDATDKEAKWKTLRQAFKCKILPATYPVKHEDVEYPSTPSPRLSRQHPSTPSPRQQNFPHSRHLCSDLPFSTTSHVKHCSMCRCFVCDAPAPCKHWGKGLSNNDHCHATDKEAKWKTLRQAFKCKTLPATYSEKPENVVCPSMPSPRQQHNYEEYTPEDNGVEEEEEYLGRDEEATVCVGNLPYNIGSEYLGQLFQYAGIVVFSEIIYDRQTGQSCGYGYVTMSTVQEAENAVKNFHLRELYGYGRLVTVSKAEAASPSGGRAEETSSPSGSGSSLFKLYVRNLPWEVDGSELKQLFSEYGEVVHAKVVYHHGLGAPRRSRGFGFVTMATQEGLENALCDLDKQFCRSGEAVNCECELHEKKGHGEAFTCCTGKYAEGEGRICLSVTTPVTEDILQK